MSSKSSFPHNSLSPLPISNASRRISSHTLTAATTNCTHHSAVKAPRDTLVDQIPHQPALRAGELDTGEATAPMEEISEDEAESFEDKCTFSSSFQFMPDNFDMNSHDIDLGTLTNKANVKWSLRKYLEHWHHIGANPSVIDTIENGYKIPFFTTSVSKSFQNNQSAIQNANFVTCTVKELLKFCRTKETRAPPYIVSPLTVAKNNHNKPRLILDLRYVNSFVYKGKIKFDDWRTMQDFVDNEGFPYKFDISQGYHHIDIDENHQKYLGSSWKIDGKIRYFMFTVLPFGLCSAPFIFTKVVRSLVKFWRREERKICLYIDDGLGASPSLDLALDEIEFVKNSLTRCDFVINSEKSVWQPQKEFIWLGIKINLITSHFTIPETGILSIMKYIQVTIKNLPYTTARNLSKLCGKIISTKFVLGNIAQLKTRNIYKIIQAELTWDKRIQLHENHKAIQEIIFWQNNLRRLNSCVLYSFQVPTVFTSSDASNHALSAQFLKGRREYICFKNFSEYEIKQSSTWRELFAIQFALHSFTPMISNKSVHWETDNYVAFLIVAPGSNKAHLQTLAEDIYDLTIQRSIFLQVKWIPRHKNQIADTFSKTYHFDDWETTDTLFHYLNRLLGPFTINMFADNENTKLKKFNSKSWCPDTSQVDVFAIGWGKDNNYLVPPIYLVTKAIKLLQSSYNHLTMAFFTILPFKRIQ